MKESVFSWTPVHKRAAFITLATWAFVAFELTLPVVVGLVSLPPLQILFTSLIGFGGVLASFLLLFTTMAARNAPPRRKIAIVAMAVFVTSAVMAAYDVYTNRQFGLLFLNGQAPPKGDGPMFAYNFIAFSWIYGFLGTVYVLLQNHAQALIRNQELADARELAKVAQLDALRLQLNPHFLFNAFNVLSSLIVTERNREGEKMLAKLSAFLRVSLNADSSSTLGQELEILQNYLEVEGTRFGSRLTVEFDCPRELLDAEVPGFILQPLIENAVKYAVAATSQPVTVRVEAATGNGDLLLKVIDNGKAAKAGQVKSGTGIGLANTRRRLEVLYGEKGMLETARTDTGFTASIRLPLKLREAAESCWIGGGGGGVPRER